MKKRSTLKTLLQLAFVLAPLASQAQSSSVPGVSAGVMGWLERAHSYTCMAYWQGYVYNAQTNRCEQRGASGCSNPFEFLTLDDCASAHRP